MPGRDPMRCAVTGSTGFVGRELREHRTDPLLARDRGKLLRPALQVDPVQLVALSEDHAVGVLEVARPPREQLVQDQILGGGEWNGTPPDLDAKGPFDRLSLVGSGREDEVDPDARAGVGRRQDEGLSNERLHVFGEGQELAFRMTKKKSMQASLERSLAKLDGLVEELVVSSEY